jgi:hypothetical protein
VVGVSREEAPVGVLAVTGLARSGSTVLDVVLGNHPQIESVGEVNLLLRTGWVGPDSLGGVPLRRRARPLCTCGRRLDVAGAAPGEACPFWSEVRREWLGRAGGLDPGHYPRLQAAFELKRRWPRLLREARSPSMEFRSYAALTRAFFESVRAVSGKPVVVDSSKAPSRAFALSLVEGIDLRAVHLVRDARGVAASHRASREERPPAGAPRVGGRLAAARRGGLYASSLGRWVAQNLAAERVCGRLGPGRCARVRYEDFAADPAGALGRVGRVLRLDLSGVGGEAASGAPMAAGHNIGGNRTKRSGSITLRPDEQEWRGALSPNEQRLSWALAGWLMRRYGYGG